MSSRKKPPIFEQSSFNNKIFTHEETQIAMVPNDIDILTQAESEIGRAKRLLSSADARFNSVLQSGNPKANYEVDTINLAMASVKDALSALSKIKL